MAGLQGLQCSPPAHSPWGKRPDAQVILNASSMRCAPNCRFQRTEELAAETCSTMGLTGSLNRSPKDKHTLASSTDLRTTLSRCVAKPAAKETPGRAPAQCPSCPGQSCSSPAASCFIHQPFQTTAPRGQDLEAVSTCFVQQ